MEKRSRRKKQNPSHIRDKWEQYGISRGRYLELREYCRGESDNRSLIEQAARETSEILWRHIYLSVTGNMTYEDVEYLDGQRIPCGRTDFYGYRRKFYAVLNEKLGKRGGYHA